MDKFRENLGKFNIFVKEKWSALSKTARIIIVAIVSAVILSLIGLAIIFGRTSYSTLYTNVSGAEQSEILAAVSALGYTDVRISGADVLVPNESVDDVRMQLSIQGFPKSTFNYDIWDNSIGMFSTNNEQRIKEQHQLQNLIMATLNTIPGVDSSKVIISMEEEDPYVISTGNDYEVKAMVMVSLKRDEYLDEKQVNGIYNLVMTAVPGLEMQNISLTDGNGILLMSEGPSASEELLMTQERFRIRRDFQNDLETSLEDGLQQLLKPFYREFSVNVTATLDYGKVTEESKTYTPSIEAAGTAGGMLSATREEEGWGGLVPEGGVVGTVTEADISPDYPTLIAEGEQDAYYQSLKQADYKVNEVIRNYESSDYMVDRISAAIILDGTQLNAQEQLNWQQLAANAIGTDVQLVSVSAQPRYLGPTQFEPGAEPNPARNTLIFIIIALGVILIILFLLAIMTSGSKKRRQVRARYAGATSGGGFVSDAGLMPATSMINPDTGEPFETFNITSLIPEEGAADTKDVVLKREIREFSSQNPDIVAQLIRQWLS
ncbi:MAG: flagellar M-ring protein FliF [Eubacterium sp.]|jgi:flagellar M-ring protein FliF|nr:flagellar M-ring protein FliF [Eubacterium sp.]